MNLKTFSFITSLLLSIAASAENLIPLSKSACQREYLSLFANSEINVTVVFGYDDTGAGQTMDIQSHENFIRTLTADCPTWDTKMCGFKKQSSNPDVLTRTFFGPDGEPKLVRITTDRSSETSSDSQNRTLETQKVRSEALKTYFAKGIKESEITIYNGHSRDGGGPSFAPPVLDEHGHTDYDYYHKHKDDKNFMTEALRASPNRPRILGLISCNSLRWFQKGIMGSAPATGIVGTDQLFYTSMFEQSITLLENIFSYQCLTKIKIRDLALSSQIQSTVGFRIPEKDKKLTKLEIVHQTLENLAKNLTSNNASIRKEAFQEIRSFAPELYSDSVKNAIKAYTFGNTVKNNF